jgi:parallel beta-helix repeat protein
MFQRYIFIEEQCYIIVQKGKGMDKYPLISKGLAVGIVLLFVGTCFIPLTAQYVEKPSLLTSSGHWLYVGGNGPGNYTTILDAVDNASDGDTVFIYRGMYNEIIVINKNQLTLIGEDKNTTIISFNRTYHMRQITINANTCSIENLQITQNNNSIIPQGILINSNYNTIKNSIIFNVTEGIELSAGSESNTIIHNEIKNNLIGIDASSSTYNNISHNIFANNTQNNIYLSTQSDNNDVSFNTMDTSAFGMRFVGSKYNNVYKNCIQNNQIGLYCCCHARSNYFYNNNFLNNFINAKNDYGLINIWYDSPNGTGNYWDDYTGLDANGDGIGDTPYKISGGDRQDLYPLMHPFELYYILNISLDNHEVNEETSFKVTMKTFGGTIVSNAQVLFNGQITLTDSNGIAQITAPSVPKDLVFPIGATKPGYTSDTDTILVKNIPNIPPNTPTITGETNGAIQTSYDYIIQTTDPDQDDVQYHIDWGDDTTITGLNESGEEIIVSHTWNKKGTYSVKVKAVDEYYAESDWGTLTVTMPCSYNKPIIHFLELLFQRFPHAFPILRQLLGY